MSGSKVVVRPNDPTLRLVSLSERRPKPAREALPLTTAVRPKTSLIFADGPKREVSASFKVAKVEPRVRLPKVVLAGRMPPLLPGSSQTVTPAVRLNSKIGAPKGLGLATVVSAAIKAKGSAVVSGMLVERAFRLPSGFVMMMASDSTDTIAVAGDAAITANAM